MTLLHSINDLLKRLARWFPYAGAILILAITALISYDVILRYAFNAPMLGTHEMVAYMLLTCFFLFIADCWNVSTHVRMSIIYEKFHGRTKQAADAFGYLSGAASYGVMAMYAGTAPPYALTADQGILELLLLR